MLCLNKEKGIDTPEPAGSENWSGNRNHLKNLFTRLTGYDWMPEGSRRDVRQTKMKAGEGARNNG